VTLRNMEDVLDFVRGCTLLATGGGGEQALGIAKLERALEESGPIRFVPASEVDDAVWTVCPLLMGTISPKPEPEGLTIVPGRQMLQVEAIRYLEEVKGIHIGAVVPPELGGEATAGAVASGALVGAAVIDGDYAGRAVPELSQATPCLQGIPMWPVATVDRFGNRVFIDECCTAGMCERIGKGLASASYGISGQAGFLIQADRMKRTVICGTLSRCLEIGRAIRAAREEGRNPVETIVEVTDAWVLFEGRVSAKTWEDREGYTWGEHEFSGTGQYANHAFRIWFKNENHMSWFDGAAYVTSPDSLAVVDKETGEPLTNMGIAEGQEVVILGIRSPEVYRSQEGIEVFGPKHFDFDVEYRPIESVVGKKGGLA